jgi:excisionase family DNA binding protein
MLKTSDSTTEQPLANTVATVCRRLGCGRSTVYGLIKSRDLEAVKLGGRTLILERSLLSLVDKLPRLDTSGDA